jgi:acyl-CoA thioesterase I
MGVTGDTVALGLKRLRDYFTGGGQAQLVVVALGANDIFQKIPRSKTEGDLHDLIAECRNRSIPVLLCGVRMPGERMADWTFRWVAWHENVPFKCDVMEGQYFHREHLQSDNTHPDAEGQKLMASSMQSILLRDFAFGP